MKLKHKKESLTLKRTLVVLLVLLISAAGAFADDLHGGILESEVEISDSMLDNTTSFELWKLFYLGNNLWLDGSVVTEFSTGEQLFTTSPAATLMLACGTVRFGSEVFFDYFVEDDKLEVSQSYWAGIYGSTGPLSGDVRVKAWTDFRDLSEFSPRARGYITLEEQGIEVEVGQVVEWVYFMDEDNDYSDDTINLDSSVRVSHVEGLRPYAMGELRHQWFQSDHESEAWTQEWTYSNSLFLEAGISPEETAFTAYANVEIPLYSEQDSTDDPIFGVGISVDLF